MTHSAASAMRQSKANRLRAMSTVEINGAEQTGDEVGAVLFQHLAVGHDGAGQVGKVTLAEEGQGSLRSRSARVRRRVPLSL